MSKLRNNYEEKDKVKIVQKYLDKHKNGQTYGLFIEDNYVKDKYKVYPDRKVDDYYKILVDIV